MRLAYSVEDSRQPGHIHRGLHEQPGQRELDEVVCQWNHVWNTSRPVLRVRDRARRLEFFDTRPGARRRDWTTGELEADVYRLCDTAQTSAALLNQLSKPAHDVEPAIAALCEATVLLRLNGKLLAVAVNAG